MGGLQAILHTHGTGDALAFRAFGPMFELYDPDRQVRAGVKKVQLTEFFACPCQIKTKKHWVVSSKYAWEAAPLSVQCPIFGD